MQVPTEIEIPYAADPLDWLCQLRDWPHVALLDSCQFGAEMGRYNIITAAPSHWLTLKDGVLFKTVGDISTQQEVSSAEDAWSAIADLMPAPVANNASELPFCSGLLGFLGYEFGHWSILKARKTSNIPFPDFAAGYYSWSVVGDNLNQKAYLCLASSCPAELQKELRQTFCRPIRQADNIDSNINELRGDLNKIDYLKSIAKILQYIAAGDCYQINYAHRFSGPCSLSPASIYRTMKTRLPAPMAAFISIDPHTALISLSPERLVSCHRGEVVAQPIKGTIRRGTSKQQDDLLKNELISSEKDRAENLMIVDLLRNDLGICCDAGSISVPKLFELQSFANVHHLVSSIRGKLRANSSPLELLRACFPGGSITGAPKYRAMEIIDELEQHPRSAYCGTVFYISDHGRLDASITIRSLVVADEQLYCWGGGGITADSDAESEYQESMTKVNLLTAPKLDI